MPTKRESPRRNRLGSGATRPSIGLGFVAEFRRVRARELEAPLRRARFRHDLGRLLDRARAAGVIRPDATVADLLLILAANGGVTASRAAERLEWSRRLADLALAGLGLDKTPDR